MVLYVAIALLALYLYARRLLPWIGRVSRVVDGDSLESRRWRSVHRIRLIGVDAPEYRQPHGKEARAALAKLVEKRLVLFVPMGIDRYGRITCRVFARWRPVAASLVLGGHAWPDGPIALLLSIVPRLRRIGLWSDRRRVHPGIWRTAQRMGMRTR